MDVKLLGRQKKNELTTAEILTIKTEQSIHQMQLRHGLCLIFVNSLVSK